ncbi:MAG: Conserved secreted protein [Pseudomonas helleri]|jgi:hypothetical protein|uniref:Uncharacterized protein n=2 Tax=Pseudomonas helleri TaxID=1608996 RepID=A0A7X1Y3M9_9PSED|nr:MULTISPECIES: hypothetical protein [Pseudomonas]MQT94376.1 hypothetical protein [Pseudomonas helleri]MQU29962.1 hypothetical protein [Pseudomonas helleri]
MKRKNASLILVVSMSISGLCLADGILKISPEQAAIEASFNLKLANRLWEESSEACKIGSTPHLLQIIKTINSQRTAQPTDHLSYRARFVYSGCASMLSDVAFISGACLNKQPTKHEIDYSRMNWEKDSVQCTSEISSPDLSLSSDEGYHSDADVEAELRKEGKSEEDIAFVKKIRQL